MPTRSRHPKKIRPGTFIPRVKVIESRLRSLDLPCEVVKYRPARGVRDDSGAAIVLSSVGTGHRTLYSSGHYDVVPVTMPGQCAPVLKGKTLFGRGTADMKSGLASMLYAALALRRLQIPLDGRIGLVFVPDEETGGRCARRCAPAAAGAARAARLAATMLGAS